MKRSRAIGILVGLVICLIAFFGGLVFRNVDNYPNLFAAFVILGPLIFGYNFIRWALDDPFAPKDPNV